MANKNLLIVKKEEIARGNASRAALRIVISIAAGIAVGVTPFITPFLTYLSVSDIASSNGFSLWINVAVVYSALLGAAMVSMLNSHSRLYSPSFAKMVFGPYRKELDQVGTEIDIDYFLSSKVINAALSVRMAIDSGVPVTWNGYKVIEIIPLVVANAALPDRGVVFLRLENSTLLCGPNYFMDNLNHFNVEHSTLLRWKATKEHLIHEYVAMIGRTIYCGLPVDMETIMSIGETK